jgi:NAD(P)-dependent dehydrogenase (short-subunit alcohol dehydrogenase family)
VTVPPLRDKITVVTGAASGIGQELARALSSAGASVVAVDRDGSGLEETCSSISTERSLPLTVDLLEDGAEDVIVGEAVSAFGSVDALVNCAGVFPTSPALKLSVEEWDHVFGLNLRAPFLCSQAAARWMVRESRPGNIINIASTAGTVARPGIAHYAASKAALIMLTKVLAIEWAEHDIRVNAVAPGLVETPGVSALLGTEEGRKEHLRKLDKIPMYRTGEPREIADAVVFLASENSSFVTGHTLFVDGGYSAGHPFRGQAPSDEGVSTA